MIRFEGYVVRDISFAMYFRLSRNPAEDSCA